MPPLFPFPAAPSPSVFSIFAPSLPFFFPHFPFSIEASLSCFGLFGHLTQPHRVLEISTHYPGSSHQIHQVSGKVGRVFFFFFFLFSLLHLSLSSSQLPSFLSLFFFFFSPASLFIFSLFFSSLLCFSNPF
jgi:hypothetical protein